MENRLEIYEVTSSDSGIYECTSDKYNSMKFLLIVNVPILTTETMPTESTDTTTIWSWWDDWSDSTTPEPTTTTEETTTNSEYYYYTQEPEVREEPVDSFVTQTAGSSVELVCSLRVANYESIVWRKLSDV